MSTGPFMFERKIESERTESGTITWYVLIGPAGATQFMLIWRREYDEPMPADLGFHSPVPVYEGQTKMGACTHLNGADCYYDGSGLMANDVYQKFKDGGQDPEIIWGELERFYNDTFP
jgi:hypothetical protein